jgi:DNA-directed RNA polymerase subunit RPC12/RpoP
MAAVYKCLSCGETLTGEQLGVDGYVAKCPKCGRDMYRSRTADTDLPSPDSVRRRTSGKGNVIIPSRYGSNVASVSFADDVDEDEDSNPLLLPHTPFIVILGFILSFIFAPAGIIISIMGLRLVNQSPKGVRGRGLAIAGIVVGCVNLVLGIILVASGVTG